MTIWHYHLSTYVFSSSEPEGSFKKLNYFKGDYLTISKCLEEINWGAAFNWLDLSQSWACFADKIVELSKKYMPVSKERDGSNKNNPYVTRSGPEAIKSKHTKWLKYKYCKTVENYVKHKKARNLIISELRKEIFIWKGLGCKDKNWK